MYRVRSARRKGVFVEISSMAAENGHGDDQDVVVKECDVARYVSCFGTFLRTTAVTIE